MRATTCRRARTARSPTSTRSTASLETASEGRFERGAPTRPGARAARDRSRARWRVTRSSAPSTTSPTCSCCAVVLVPVFYLLPWSWARRLLLALSGAYLIFLIAPRLALFYVVFWLVIFALQHAHRRCVGERAGGGSGRAAASPLRARAVIVWKLFPVDSITWFNSDLRSPRVSAPVELRSVRSTACARSSCRSGCRFATFRAVDLLIQVRISAPCPLKPVASTSSSFGFFPPVQVIGPVIEYAEVDDGVAPRRAAPARATTSVGVHPGRRRRRQGVRASRYRCASSVDLFIVYRTNVRVAVAGRARACTRWYFYLNFSGLLRSRHRHRLGCSASSSAPNFSRPYPQDEPAGRSGTAGT